MWKCWEKKIGGKLKSYRKIDICTFFGFIKSINSKNNNNKMRKIKRNIAITSLKYHMQWHCVAQSSHLLKLHPSVKIQSFWSKIQWVRHFMRLLKFQIELIGYQRQTASIWKLVHQSWKTECIWVIHIDDLND